MDARLTLKQLGLKEHEGELTAFNHKIILSVYDIERMRLLWFTSLSSNFTHFKIDDYSIWLLCLFNPTIDSSIEAVI